MCLWDTDTNNRPLWNEIKAGNIFFFSKVGGKNILHF